MSELYIGKYLDPNGMPGELYRHKLSDLITHTFICGGSGSGKTVMGKAIIEEAALKGVPSIIVDLKGDLSSLALVFGELAAPAVAPWVEVEDKSTLGRAALAEANTFRKRLWDWGLAETNVREFSNQVAVEIFTPRSELGRRVSIPLISSPPPDINKLFDEDPDTASVMVTSMAEALVRRVIPSGQRDRETDFVTALIEHAWRTGVDLTDEAGLGQLVSMILEPPFATIGVLGIDDHIPENRRQKLAQAVNGQLVGAAANWVRGEEMSIDKLVGANRVDGKTQISVVSLAHITDFEDQSFVVAQIAFAINAWMRKQGSAPGGNRPRLLFFLDEIGGGGGKTAFYPTYPYTSTCKPALNILVKQGRAFGVGCILATQNPGDIDYKGLSNCATWIVGKLQTKRDRDKVREGLTDAEFSPSDLAKKIARPKTGEFMLLNKEGDVHFIKERWLLTYHCTMSPEQLRRYKGKGLAPYEGSLNTDIVFEGLEEIIKSDEQEETQSLWNDAKDAIGQACNLLEKILEYDINSEKARLWISILRDPDGFNRHLQDAQRQLAEYATAAPSPNASKSQEPSGLITLLSEKKSANQGPLFSHIREVTIPVSTLPPSDSVLVEDDGSVTYKGRRFQLYRRYAGKAVAFIEENGQLKFSVEGKVLSKSFNL
ncbi:TPA: ATP-binding protein [Aeromonas dhakensis]|nr:ATP-binding protein [Aeromonas dhakensis]